MRHIYELTTVYNSETGTTQHETTMDLYTFDELPEEARTRVIREYTEEREAAGNYYQEFADCHEFEIWNGVRHLEKQITGASVKWSYNPWYSADFDCTYKINDIDWAAPDHMEPATDNGVWCSMDICDAWNAHIRRLNAIESMYTCMVEARHDKYPAHEWENDGDESNKYFYSKLEDLADNLHDRWICELEAACNDVRDTIEYVLQSEWEYYASEEFARYECEEQQGTAYRWRDNAGRVFYCDNRKWYTVDGEFIEQTNTNECISLARIA